MIRYTLILKMCAVNFQNRLHSEKLNYNKAIAIFYLPESEQNTMQLISSR